MQRFVIINKKYVYFNHVAQVKRTGYIFPKNGVQAMVITEKGKVPFELSHGGEFCRIHEGIFDSRKDGDAFVYDDGAWICLVLETVDFVEQSYK